MSLQNNTGKDQHSLSLSLSASLFVPIKIFLPQIIMVGTGLKTFAASRKKLKFM